MNLVSERERRRYRRSRYTAAFALAGLLDISLSCLVLARLNVPASVLWGLAGALAYALVYLTFSLSSEYLGSDPEGDASVSTDSDDDFLDGLLGDIDVEDDEDVALRWWENLEVWLVGGAVIVGATLWLFLLSNAKSIVVVLGFAALSSDATLLGFLVVVTVSGTAQLLAMYFGFLPAAKRRGFNL